MSLTSYRPDIDGLRAIAVASVLIYHAAPNLLPGGFAGVDIFFVISGYLITNIIINEIDQKKFSFLNFYARRIKRIFPALILVLLFCICTGWFLLFNDEFKQLGNHAMRATVFLSNFILWKEVGYFDLKAEFKPLLHLWSLAIEEQFYIIWPAFLFLALKYTHRAKNIIFIFLISSLIWNIYQGFNNPTHAFYSPLTRFWELTCGALIVFYSRSTNKFSKFNWLGLTGLIMILSSLMFLGHAPFYPGIWAIFPVMGALLCIVSNGNHPFTNWILTSQPVVELGKISYSLYLWHWPLLVFPQIILGEKPPLFISLISLCLSVILAILSTKYLESWFRFGQSSYLKVSILISAMFAIFLAGYQINRLQGLDNRLIHDPSLVIRDGDIGQEPFYDHIRTNYFECTNQSVKSDSGKWQDFSRCFESNPTKDSLILLLGDSHAEHLFPGFAKELNNSNITFWGKLGPPLLSNKNYAVIFDELKNQTDYQYVLLSAHWHAYSAKLPNQNSLYDDLRTTIDLLQAIGKKVIIFDDVHEFEFTPLRCKYQRPLSLTTKCHSSIEDHMIQKSRYYPTFEKLSKSHPSLKFISISDIFCNNKQCSMHMDETILYRDQHHLNITGSSVIAENSIKQMHVLLNQKEMELFHVPKH